MPITHVTDLVTDWGGFEALVAELHSTGEVTVERNVVLRGRSGATRQIDVLVRHRQGLYEHLVIVECKYLRKPVTRAAVDAVATAVRDLGASRGVIFSSSGFQAGAVRQARHETIDLFRVRDVSLMDRGERYLGCLLRVFHHSPLSIRSISYAGDAEIELEWGMNWSEIKDGERPRAEVVSGAVGLEEGKFDAVLASALQLACDQYQDLIKPDHRGSFSYRTVVELTPLTPVTVTDQGDPLDVSKFRIDVGVSGYQDGFVVDRLQQFAFVIAVEDCVRANVHAFSKKVCDLQFLETLASPLRPSGWAIEKSPDMVVCIGVGQTTPEQFAELIPSIVHYDR